MPAPTAVEIVVCQEERAQLESWARRRTSTRGLADRSASVVAAADGLKNSEIAARLGVHRSMATKWRNRFAQRRLDGLVDEPRRGRPRTITDEQVEEVIIKTLERTPSDATHCSTRSMAQEVGLAQNAMSRSGRRSGCSLTGRSPGALQGPSVRG